MLTRFWPQFLKMHNICKIKRYMSRYKAILFDLDGTLRANLPEGFQVFIEYASRVGIALDQSHIEICERAVHQYWADGAQVVDHLSRYDERGFWVNYNHLLLDAMAIPHTEDIAEKIQDQFKHYDPQNVVFADVPYVLESLRQTGHVVGLVSNREGEVDTEVTRYGFRHLLDFTLTGGQAHSWKPDAGIFRRALQLAGDVPADSACYVGDNYYADIVGARNVGMDAILIDPRDVFHGYYDKRVKTLLEVLSMIVSAH